MTIEILKKLWRNEYFQTALTIALLFLIVFGIYYGAQAALGTQYPALAVASGSMLPTLNIGDLIIVQKVDPAQINASKFHGDILVFRSPRDPDDLIVHRAIRVQPAGNYYMITTAGDADGDRDQFSPWNSSLLIGKVVARIPYIGNIPLLLHSERNIYILLLVFITLLILLILPFESNEGETKAEGAEGKPVEERKPSKIDLSHIFHVVLDVIIIGLIFFCLWGSYTFWQPGATPSSATIRGMYADQQYHESFPNVYNVYLSQGFLTYRIDCEISGGTRLGVPTFAWYQFFILIFVLFNALKIYRFWKTWRARKQAEQATNKRLKNFK